VRKSQYPKQQFSQCFVSSAVSIRHTFTLSVFPSSSPANGKKKSSVNKQENSSFFGVSQELTRKKCIHSPLKSSEHACEAFTSSIYVGKEMEV
jgi:hypothetical protein